MFDYMELQFGYTVARQLTWKRSKTEPIDFSWELGENTSRQQLQATCIGCPQAKTSLADIVILALHITKRGAQN